MIRSVLVVCVGNICRSPLGERALKARCPQLEVASAGIGALVGRPADSEASAAAASLGISLEGHSARQFVPEMAADCDLILAMEPGHRREIAAASPHLSGRTMLFDHWTGAAGIPDPFRRSAEIHAEVAARIVAAADAWAQRIG